MNKWVNYEKKLSSSYCHMVLLVYVLGRLGLQLSKDLEVIVDGVGGGGQHKLTSRLPRRVLGGSVGSGVHQEAGDIGPAVTCSVVLSGEGGGGRCGRRRVTSGRPYPAA